MVIAPHPLSARGPAGTSRAVPWSAVWRAIASVPDPEIPVLSVLHLGIVRCVRWDPQDPHVLVVQVTPTYSGCPATELIMDALADAVRAAGVPSARIERVLSPAWSTSWMAPSAFRALRDYGIAPPGSPPPGGSAVVAMHPARTRGDAPRVACPRCGSLVTERLAQFGSTPCKAQYRCRECLEPFDFFKPL